MPPLDFETLLSPAGVWLTEREKRRREGLNMPDIHFECPKCNQMFEAPEEYAAQLIGCPQSAKRFATFMCVVSLGFSGRR